jgi:hypothetical protein
MARRSGRNARLADGRVGLKTAERRRRRAEYQVVKPRLFWQHVEDNVFHPGAPKGAPKFAFCFFENLRLFSAPEAQRSTPNAELR